MTFSFDLKGDLRLRMADLEKKLAESEEERCKLEKTCNVLMRAFREEERIQYKTLNKNYEKFLQDCTARKRRNDIILRSLCRIEDRSRALFAKTERLKLLKDRYVSYLKVTDIKGGISSHTWRSLPPTSSSLKTTKEATPKLVPRKNFLTTDHRVADLEGKLGDSKTYDVTPQRLVLGEQFVNECGKNIKANVFDGILPAQAPDRSYSPKNKLFLAKTKVDSPPRNAVVMEDLTANAESYGVSKNNMCIDPEVVKIPVSKERNNYSHQESAEKLKKVHSFEDKLFDNENNHKKHDPDDKKVFEKDDIKHSEKNDDTCPKITHYMTSSSSTFEEEYQDNPVDFETDMKTESAEGNLPMGLDGVDYQNETYPESYYEQPVHHHNHTSIVADVILEEDETEQEDEAQFLTKDNSLTWKESPGQRAHEADDRPQQIRENETNSKAGSGLELNEKNVEEVNSGEIHSEKSLEEREEKLPEENFEKRKNIRSNLIHLLESDSESFQIEHGDAVSGNEDSDFDFSFH